MTVSAPYSNHWCKWLLWCRPVPVRVWWREVCVWGERGDERGRGRDRERERERRRKSMCERESESESVSWYNSDMTNLCSLRYFRDLWSIVSLFLIRREQLFHMRYYPTHGSAGWEVILLMINSQIITNAITFQFQTQASLPVLT